MNDKTKMNFSLLTRFKFDPCWLVRRFFIVCLLLTCSHGWANARNQVIIGQTLNAAYMGFAYGHGVTEDDFGRTAGLGAGLGLGLYGSYLFTDKEPLNNSQALMLNSLSFWSAAWAASSTWLFSADSQKIMLASGLFDGLVTAVTAFNLQNINTSAGDMALINTTALWGTIMTIELAAAISPEPSGRAKYVVFTALTGSLTGGYFLAKNNELSPERSVKINLYGVLGTFTGAGFAWVMYFRSKRAYFVSMLVGTGLGLYLGYHLTDEEKRVNQQPFLKTSSASSLAQANFSLGSYSW